MLRVFSDAMRTTVNTINTAVSLLTALLVQTIRSQSINVS